MEYAYPGIVLFLFLLAIVDLSVGVSNDAVNFLSAAVGAKAASLRRILIIASAGILLGAATGNGMMEIARHGIFRPEHFHFAELMCIFLAVAVSDVILLDVFNSLGLPTSTTVSMIFELLGASFVIALFKLHGAAGEALRLTDLLNTERALTVIIGIFLSVALAFLFGALVQWLTRLLFTFHYRRAAAWKELFFSSFAALCIAYFMLIKGLKGSTLLTPELRAWTEGHPWLLWLGGMAVSLGVMAVLQRCGVHLLKGVVLLGTFALAMAFAGNDLVNFIGVTLAGYDSYADFRHHADGATPDAYLMSALNAPASVPPVLLLAAGGIMVFALITSRKARRVLQTSIDLSRQDEGEESFGSSAVARSIVRSVTGLSESIARLMPTGIQRWVEHRFERPADLRTDGAAFDLLRASVNLVAAALLIALGTSLKLPLSTTYVAFMVAMGTSLADRAWGRESAVYRVSGVVTVIGGWFVTAGAAFLFAAVVVSVLYWGGMAGAVLMMAVAVLLLVRSRWFDRRRTRQPVEEQGSQILNADDPATVWQNLRLHVAATQSALLYFTAETYRTMFQAFSREELRSLRLARVQIVEQKELIRAARRLESRGLQRLDRRLAFQKNAWYYLCSNSCLQLLNTLHRICDPMKEHTDNSFPPLPALYVEEFAPLCDAVAQLLERIAGAVRSGDYTDAYALSVEGKNLKRRLSDLRTRQTARLTADRESLKVSLVYLNLIQESHELLSQVRNLLRGSVKFT